MKVIEAISIAIAAIETSNVRAAPEAIESAIMVLKATRRSEMVKQDRLAVMRATKGG